VELPLVEVSVLVDRLVPPGPELLDAEVLLVELPVLVDVLVPPGPELLDAEVLVAELPELVAVLSAPLLNPPSGAAPRLCPGVYVGSADAGTTFDPHTPVPGWQLSPLGHVDIGSPPSPASVTCPSHSAAKTRSKTASRLVGTCTCATRCTTGVPPGPCWYAVTTMSTSSGLCPANSVNVAGSVTCCEGSR
jgi:hypothetical protein